MAVCMGNALYTVVVGRWNGAPDGMLSCNTRGCAEGHNSQMRQLDRKHHAKIVCNNVGHQVVSCLVTD